VNTTLRETIGQKTITIGGKKGKEDKQTYYQAQWRLREKVENNTKQQKPKKRGLENQKKTTKTKINRIQVYK